MPKSKRPSVRPRRPGVGLGQIIPDRFADEEAPTLKRAAVPEEGPTHKLPVIDTEQRTACPRCHGKTILHVDAVDSPSAKPNLKKYGKYFVEWCTSCIDGKTTSAEAEAIRAAIKSEAK